MSRAKALRDACRERCAEFGDPPCHELDYGGGAPSLPCNECLADIGEDPAAELDPAAVVRPLFPESGLI